MTTAVYAPQRTTQGNAIFGSQGTAVTPPFFGGGGGGGASRRQVFIQEPRRRKREEEKPFDEDAALAKTEREMMTALGFPPEQEKKAAAPVKAGQKAEFTREDVEKMVRDRVDREVRAIIDALMENLL